MRRTKRESQRTRRRILAAARKVFASQGVTRTTLEEIADAASVTRGAIYWHFADKNELFFAMREQVAVPMIDQIDLALRRSDGSDPLAGVERFLLGILEALESNATARQTFQIMGFKCEYVGECLEPRGFAPRLLLASALLRHLRVGLGEGDLVGDGVDLEEGAALAHEIPFVVEALEQDSRNACAHLDFLGALHLADGLENDRHALRRHLEHPRWDAGRGRIGCGGVGPALFASCEQGCSEQCRKRWDQAVTAAEFRPSVSERHARDLSCRD